MTRSEFLNELYRRLGTMPKEEAEQHLTYYAEMLSDRIEDGMTEEEAVAAMESVEEIARKILRERATGDSGQPEKPAAAAPVKRKWRWWLVAAAVLLLPAVGLALLAGMFAFQPSGEGNRAEPMAESIAGGQTAPSRPPVDESAGTFCQIPAEGIRDLQIQWGSGLVEILRGEGDQICLREYPEEGGEVLESEPAYRLDGDELEVSAGRGAAGHRLVVEIPADMTLSELEINSGSAEVLVENIAAAEFSVETGSGTVYTRGDFRSVSAESDSGEVTLDLRDSAELREIEVESVSGDVDVVLWEDASFRLEYASAAGELQWGNFVLVKTGRYYVCGDGDIHLEIETGSADVRLRA